MTLACAQGRAENELLPLLWGPDPSLLPLHKAAGAHVPAAMMEGKEAWRRGEEARPFLSDVCADPLLASSCTDDAISQAFKKHLHANDSPA